MCSGNRIVRAVFALLLMAVVGCASPTLSMTHEPGLDTARTKMFALTAGGARLASLEMPVADEQKAPSKKEDLQPPTPKPDEPPAVGAAPPQTSGECEQLERMVTRILEDHDSRLTAMDKRLTALEALCANCKDCKCTPLTGSTGGPKAASSPAVDWPPGCHVEVWVAIGCQPCERFELEEASKLPATAYTIRSKNEEEEIAAAKGVDQCPYYILKDSTGRELTRVRGFVTAEWLAMRTKQLLAPPMKTAAVYAQPRIVSASVFGDSAYLSNLKQHMATTHGQDCSGMSEAETEAAHNAAHSGLAGSRVRMPAQTVRYVGATSRNGTTRVRYGCKTCR